MASISIPPMSVPKAFQLFQPIGGVLASNKVSSDAIAEIVYSENFAHPAGAEPPVPPPSKEPATQPANSAQRQAANVVTAAWEAGWVDGHEQMLRQQRSA